MANRPISPYKTAQKAPKATQPKAPLSQKPLKTSARSTSGKSPLANKARPAGKPGPRPAVSAVPAQQRAAAPARKGTIGALISRRASERLRNGHLWVYASDLEALEAGPGDPPALLPVADNRGLLLGTALYSPASQIALRMVSRQAIDQAGWLELLAVRFRRAIEKRLPFLLANKRGSDSCRLCFSEADELPGLVVDKYGELIVVQLLVKGLDTPAVRRTVLEVLRGYGKFFEPAAIWERPDPRIRELEGLGEPSLEPLYSADPEDPLTGTHFRLNGLKFFYQVNSGQKTGAFLDQQANYQVAKEYAWLLAPGKRALDVCTYQGGFALHLASVSGQVTGIDASRASLEVAEQNLAANRDVLGDKEIQWVCGDAFDVLREWAQAREQFDSIVLDPPAFAKSIRAVEGALRGYKELNLRAMQMLRPGGLLVTCSCSHHVSGSDLEAAVASAAADSHRRVTLLQRRGAAPDHPVVLNLPETEYLKCLICQVD
jgi:23S rRNA (cytosine1962-C5)-methyltransferase